MLRKIYRPTPAEDELIARGIAEDPDTAPDLSNPVPGIILRPGRPKLAEPKEAINIRLDADVLAHFKAKGPGWQSRMNEALRKAVGL